MAVVYVTFCCSHRQAAHSFGLWLTNPPLTCPHPDLNPDLNPHPHPLVAAAALDLYQAGMSSLQVGGGGCGYMDGTVFREVLNALKDEVAADPSLMLNGVFAANLSSALDKNMHSRQRAWAPQQYPYGSEFGFDTTGQEEVVIWNMYYGNTTAAKRTVDHI